MKPKEIYIPAHLREVRLWMAHLSLAYISQSGATEMIWLDVFLWRLLREARHYGTR